MFKIKYNSGYTLVELVVSILVTVIILGGVFYFISDALSNILDSSSKAEFLGEIYSATRVLGSGDIEILHDLSSSSGSDIILERSTISSGAVAYGIVNTQTKRFLSGSTNQVYTPLSIGYRDISAEELVLLDSDPQLVYSYQVFPDKIFDDIFIRDMQVDAYNSGSLHTLRFEVVGSFRESLVGEAWSNIPQDEHFYYSVTH